MIWSGIPYETPVIPAKAGIQSVASSFPKVCGVDSRFRGNDCGLERLSRANDTTTLPYLGALIQRGATSRHGGAAWAAASPGITSHIRTLPFTRPFALCVEFAHTEIGFSSEMPDELVR